MKRRRADGRGASQLRPIAVEFGLLHSVDGSARLTLGGADGATATTRVLVGVQGPRPPRVARFEDPERALVEVIVLPVSGAAGVREGALEAAILAVLGGGGEDGTGSGGGGDGGCLLLSAHPRTVISLTVHVQCDGGGLEAAAVNAAVLAVVDAGIPLRYMPGAVSVGVWGGGGGGGEGPLVAAAAAAATDYPLDLLLPEEQGAALTLAAVTAAAAASGSASTSDADAATASSAAGAAVVGGACRVRATAVFSPAELSDSTRGPLYLRCTGPASVPELGALLDAARAGAGAMVAFLRLAAKKKVLRDAVNYAGGIAAKATVEELEAMAFGVTPQAGATGAEGMEAE
jgi:hypothetical protein